MRLLDPDIIASDGGPETGGFSPTTVNAVVRAAMLLKDQWPRLHGKTLRPDRRAPALKADRPALAFLPFSLSSAPDQTVGGWSTDGFMRCRCHGLNDHCCAPAPLGDPEKFAGIYASRTIPSERAEYSR